MEYSIHDGIGYRQLMILQCIWESEGPLTAGDIVDMLEQKCGQRLSRANVTTLCNGLLKRKFIKLGKKKSHAFTYEPVITEEEYRERELTRFKKTTFGGSSSDLVVALMKTDKMKAEDVDTIQKILKEYEK